MSESDAPAPDFGEGVARRDAACTPRELFCALFVDLERSVHFLAPAFELARSLLSPEHAPLDAELCRATSALDAVSASAFTERLERSGRVPAAPLDGRPGSSWPPRLVRELGPLGLSDGAWLRGWVQVNMVESEVGMRMLRQLMLRLGDPGSREGHAARFAALLKSLGTPPESITRWEWDESAPCADISYEHALLGLCLGFFPSSFSLETLGYNLWMAAVGPCPLLDDLAPSLRQRGANLRYLDQQERTTLADLARQAVLHALAESDTPPRRRRIARGVAAARASYLRWQDAMLGRNVPFSPRDFVLEGIRRKARFAIEHHRDVRLARCSVAELIAQGGDAHELLLDKIAASRLVKPGDPDQSRFISHSITIDGPMFDAFTAAEKLDLREWIERLGEPTRSPRSAPVPLAGRYTPPQDPDDLERFAFERYGELSNNDLYHRFANADLHPAIIVFGRIFVAEALERLCHALDNDPRLGSMNPPRYSERVAAEMVAEQHEKNVRSRNRIAPEAEAQPGSGGPTNPIAAIFDGCWLQGFADVRRSEHEEYGWLFRIYASEHGDGELEWNHDLIFRRALTELGPDVMLPKTDRRLYDLFAIGVGSVATLAVSLNTQRFLPEILGLNLGIEATGVGGEYLDNWKVARAEGPGSHYKALAARLHNSIDNYADGHTKWSLAAVQAFMRRVKEAAPSQLDAQWRRIWRLWRCQDIFTHGTEIEKQALAEHFGVTSLAPTG
ncbi:iron-containing redox enzyme family protein [Sorangium sp. So ce861]|uniref:iron-containing redox enzyme family protein n=1 Tax=Sorangium sp. So ce861 TaxID=3133323 RepID=UPI003F5F3640